MNTQFQITTQSTKSERLRHQISKTGCITTGRQIHYFMLPVVKYALGYLKLTPGICGMLGKKRRIYNRKNVAFKHALNTPEAISYNTINRRVAKKFFMLRKEYIESFNLSLEK